MSHRAGSWLGGGKHVTEWATDGEGNNGVGSSHLVLYSRSESMKGKNDGRTVRRVAPERHETLHDCPQQLLEVARDAT